MNITTQAAIAYFKIDYKDYHVIDNGYVGVLQCDAEDIIAQHYAYLRTMEPYQRIQLMVMVFGVVDDHFNIFDHIEPEFQKLKLLEFNEFKKQFKHDVRKH